MVNEQLSSTIVGGPERVKEKLESFIRTTQADEIMVNSESFEHADRMRSFEIIAELKQLSKKQCAAHIAFRRSA